MWKSTRFFWSCPVADPSSSTVARPSTWWRAGWSGSRRASAPPGPCTSRCARSTSRDERGVPTHRDKRSRGRRAGPRAQRPVYRSVTSSDKTHSWHPPSQIPLDTSLQQSLVVHRGDIPLKDRGSMTQKRHPRHGRTRSLAVSGWPLRFKVALAIAIPLLLAAALGGVQVRNDLREAANSSSSAKQV